MAESLKPKKSFTQSMTVNSEAGVVDSVETLAVLWRVYESLPECAERDYVWDEIFGILSSLLKMVLKNAPESEILSGDECSRAINH